jgi:hypothetical protein
VSDFQPTEFERELLASVAGDEPGPRLAPKVAAAVGIAGSALTHATVASGATALVLKYLGVGLAGGLLVMAGASQLRQQPERPSAAPVTRSRAPVAPVAQVRPAVAAAGVSSAAAPAARARPAPSDPETVVDDPIVAPPSVGVFPDLQSTTPLSAPARPTLAEEVRALDEARQALRQGQPGHALALLESRRQGALAAEAAVLRVEALIRSGQRAAAEREAAPILAQNPTGLHATRVRSLLGGSHP